jgi:hypothetical protein
MGIVFKTDACAVLQECEVVAHGERCARRRGLPAALTQAVYNWRSQVGLDGAEECLVMPRCAGRN